MNATAETEAETEGTTFKNARAFSSFSVDDRKEAKEFYGRTLGLDVFERPEGLELRIAGGSRVFVYPKPDHTPAAFTILNFPVPDIERAVDELTSRGIRFERYEKGELETNARGIASPGDGMKIAWFKDPAGNFLSVLRE